MHRFKTPLFAEVKPSDTAGGGTTPAPRGNTQDLLTKEGIFLCGEVMLVEDSITFEGVAKASGKPYKFTQRKISIFAGKKTIDVIERLDPQRGKNDFIQLKRRDVVEMAVGNPRIDGGQVVFEMV